MHLEFNLDSGTRLDIGISGNFPELFSRSHVQKIIHEGQVRVNGEICTKPSSKWQKESFVEIDYRPPVEYDLTPNAEYSVPVLFQDKYLAIIHKPAGMTVHPGTGTKDDTLVHVLLSQIDRLSEGSEESRPGIVHRLDRETEGLMVIAKDNHSHFELSQLFFERKITKQYYAAVWGITPEHEKLDGFIGRHPANRKKMLFEHIKLNSTFKDASLEYTTLKQNDLFSMLKINLYTGRTHQIRASLSKIDHPVLGDELYSRYHRRLEKTRLPAETKEKIISGGLYLMACHLSFKHPFTQEELDFDLPVPDRFTNLFNI